MKMVVTHGYCRRQKDKVLKHPMKNSSYLKKAPPFFMHRTLKLRN